MRCFGLFFIEAFELCRVGDLNCSHMSLTSPDTLSALRELPKTNPRLHSELVGAGEAPPLGADDEEPFADEVEDDSDIPITAVVTHVASGRLDVAGGFEVLEDGSIGRVSLVEDADADMRDISREEGGEKEPEEKEEKKGRGYRKKIPKVPFQGLGAWERD